MCLIGSVGCVPKATTEDKPFPLPDLTSRLVLICGTSNCHMIVSQESITLFMTIYKIVLVFSRMKQHFKKIPHVYFADVTIVLVKFSHSYFYRLAGIPILCLVFGVHTILPFFQVSTMQREGRVLGVNWSVIITSRIDSNCYPLYYIICTSRSQ